MILLIYCTYIIFFCSNLNIRASEKTYIIFFGEGETSVIAIYHLFDSITAVPCDLKDAFGFISFT